MKKINLRGTYILNDFSAFFHKNFCTTSELSKMLGVNIGTILKWIKKMDVDYSIKIANQTFVARLILPILQGKKIVNIKSGGNEKIIKKTEELVSFTNLYIKDNYCTLNELGNIMHVHSATPQKWIKKNLINDYVLINGLYLIKKSIIPKLKKELGFNENYNNETYISMRNLAEIVNVHLTTLHRRTDLRELYIVHYGSYYISQELIEECKNRLSVLNFNLENYYSDNELANLLSISRKAAADLIRRGAIYGGQKIRSKKKSPYWIVAKKEVEEYLVRKSKGENLRKKTGYVNVKEASERIQVSKGSIYKLIKNKEIKGVLRDREAYFIPENSLIDIGNRKTLGVLQPKKKKNKKNKKVKNRVKFTPEEAEKKFRLLIKSKVGETKKIYISFAMKRIYSSKGNESTLNTKVLGLASLYNDLIYNLSKEIFEMSEGEIESIINDSEIAMYKRKNFLQFVEYAFAQKDIDQEKRFYITKELTPLNEKEIYTAEIFYKYFQFVNDIEKHISLAIKDPHYAQMWLYVIMHLIDIWRPSDLVLKFPDIDIDLIPVESLNFFLDRRLSIESSQIIINSVRIKTKHIFANKNNMFLTFLVPPDMINITATAMVICELHRRKLSNEYIFESFISGSYKTVGPPNDKHLAFFNGDKTLEDFRSYKMNSSVMTYLFYSLEDSIEDADIALEFARIARSHKEQDTSAIYVASTNKDGSINKVAWNLFKRGNFGWLYNYMISSMLQIKKGVQTIDQRTVLIEQLKNKLSLQELEGWAEFISTFRNKQCSVISNIIQLGGEEFSKLIKKILIGQMPSRNECGQCLVYPNCTYPRKKSCFSCEYFLPEIYVLLEANIELNRLTKSIKSSKYETIIKRDSHLLKHVLLIFEEAIVFWGEERVNAFQTVEEIENKVNSIVDKILLT